MKQYTIILYTRLNRKVFDNAGAAGRVAELAEESMPDGAYLHEYRVFPDSFAFTVSMMDGLSAEGVSFAVRKATSAKIRAEFEQFRKMPSLWQRKYALSSKPASEMNAEDTSALSPEP